MGSTPRADYLSLTTLNLRFPSYVPETSHRVFIAHKLLWTPSKRLYGLRKQALNICFVILVLLFWI